MTNDRKLRRRRGNITPIFCMFVFVLIGSISYSLYIGQLVTDRMAEQTAADVTAVSAANHVAQGLNMISANNLSIGAAVQVAGSISNLALYLGTIRALLITEDELPFALGIGYASPAQKNIYDPMARISQPFLQAASGMTALNKGIYDYWQYMTPVRAMEVARVNVPGSLALAVPRVLYEDEGVIEERKYQFNGMRVTEPNETICRSYRAADVGSGITQITTWLSAPFASLTNGAGSGFGTVVKMIETVDEKLKLLSVIGIDVIRGGTSCGLELNVWIGVGVKTPRWLRRMGWPEKFGNVGGGKTITVPLAKHGKQAEYFSQQHENSKDKFGFLIPIKVDGENSPTVFERSIEYAQVVTAPIRSIRQVSPANCPSSWKRGLICDGIGLTSFAGDHIDDPSKSALPEDEKVRNVELNLLSGGMQASMNAGGDMASLAGRMKYRVSQAKAVFRPRANAARANHPEHSTPQYLSTFWPGWESTLTHPTLLPGIVSKITGMTGMSEFGVR